MPVLFALVMFGPVFYPHEAIRIGAYEKLAQCQQQGRALIEVSGRLIQFRCIPVNK